MTVSDTFERMLSNFNPVKAAGVNKTFQWNIAENEIEKWALQVQNQTCELIHGGVEKPDILFQANKTDWLAISEGKLDATKAFMSGKLKIAGDIGLAMKMSSLFPEQKRA